MARSVTSDMSTNLLKRERVEQTKPGWICAFVENFSIFDAHVTVILFLYELCSPFDFLIFGGTHCLLTSSLASLGLAHSLHSFTTMTHIRALEFFSGIGGLVCNTEK